MEPDDLPESVFVTGGVVQEPVALLVLSVGIIAAIAWLVLTSGDLATPASWAYGK